MDDDIFGRLDYFVSFKDSLVDDIINNNLINSITKLKLLSENELLPYGSYYGDAPQYIIQWMEDVNLEENKRVDFYRFALSKQDEQLSDNILDFVDENRIIGTFNKW